MSNRELHDAYQNSTTTKSKLILKVGVAGPRDDVVGYGSLNLIQQRKITTETLIRKYDKDNKISSVDRDRYPIIKNRYI